LSSKVGFGDWGIEEEDKKMQFLAGFRKILKLLNIIKTFSDYQKSDLLMAPETLREYQKQYLKIAEDSKTAPKDSLIANFDFAFELMRTDEINVGYILEMMDKGQTREFVMSFVESSSTLSPKAELFNQFFDQDKTTEQPTSARFEEFRTQKAQKVKSELIKENKIIPEKFERLAYLVSSKGNTIKQSEIEENLYEKPTSLPKKHSILKNIKAKLTKFWEVFVKGF
jgi:type I restriction enzyme R subunit